MSEKPTLVVYGNCAANFLAGVLRGVPALVERYDISWIRNFWVPPGARTEEPVDMGVLPRCAVFLEQVGNFRDDLLRRGAPLREIPLPPGCRRVRFPPLFFNTLWPFVARDPRSDVAIKPWCNEGPYPAHLANRLILEIMKETKDPEEIYQRFMATKVADKVNLDRLHSLTMTKIRRLDRESDVTVGDFIDSHFTTTRLFRVQVHPAGPMLRHFCEAVFGCLDLGAEPDGERLADIATGPGIGGYDAPVHPDIVRHFGLTWAEGLRYQHFADGWFSYEEFIRRYIRFDWCLSFYLGVHLAQDGNRLLEAETLLGEACKRPDAPPAFFRELGKVFERLGWTDRARAAYLRAASSGRISRSGLQPSPLA